MLKYHVSGEGDETLLLITGAGLSKWMWHYQMSLPYQLIVFDLPGHGDNSDIQFETIEQTSEMVLDIIHSEGLSKVHIMGHSIGGQIILHILQNHHDLIEKAIIVSGYNYPAKINQTMYRLLINCCMPLMKYNWFAKLQAKTLELPSILFDDYKKDSYLIANDTVLNMVVENQKFSFDSSDFEGENALILVGDQELKKMKLSGEKNQRVLQGSTLDLLPSGHGMPYAIPEMFNRRVIDFIGNLK